MQKKAIIMLFNVISYNIQDLHKYIKICYKYNTIAILKKNVINISKIDYQNEIIPLQIWVLSS
jgi:hypothetical protein